MDASFILAAMVLAVTLIFWGGWFLITSQTGYGLLSVTDKTGQPGKKWAKARFSPDNHGPTQKNFKAGGLKMLSGLAGAGEDLAVSGSQAVNGLLWWSVTVFGPLMTAKRFFIAIMICSE